MQCLFGHDCHYWVTYTIVHTTNKELQTGKLATLEDGNRQEFVPKSKGFVIIGIVSSGQAAKGMNLPTPELMAADALSPMTMYTACTIIAVGAKHVGIGSSGDNQGKVSESQCLPRAILADTTRDCPHPVDGLPSMAITTAITAGLPLLLLLLLLSLSIAAATAASIVASCGGDYSA